MYKNYKLFEAMTLNLLVEDVIKGNKTETCVVYSFNGPAMNGIGNYVVHSFIINGIHRSLSTFDVFSESKETLKDLQITTLDILSAESNYNYKPDEIFKRVSFAMSDSIAHNLGVVEEVCKDLNVKEVPGSLLCNVHPLMVFDRKMKKGFCQKLHGFLGREKLADYFLVAVDFRRESFPIKAIKCLSNFICKDFSASHDVIVVHILVSLSNQNKM